MKTRIYAVLTGLTLAIGIVSLALPPRPVFGQTLGTSQAQTMPSIGLTATTNQIATGAGSNITTVNFPASSGAVTVTMPSATATLATVAGTESLTGKTLTANINADTKFATTQFDATSGTTGTTLTAVVGMSQTVVVGTYLFQIYIPGVATANSGNKYAFKYTTTVLSGLEATGVSYTAAAVAVQHTTTASDLSPLFAATAANIYTVITGRMVVSTGGTVAFYAAQNASHADTTSVYVGASMTFTRVS